LLPLVTAIVSKLTQRRSACQFTRRLYDIGL